ncbi:MAG: hypothetical protein GWP59_08720 [Chlamydiales bacterium]|nr:hypothetical protein [Chlamydiales bacterium]
MKFLISDQVEKKQGDLVYINKEHSFDCTSGSTPVLCTVLINNLNLSLDEDYNLIAAWGLCPLVEAEPIDFFPEQYQAKKLRILIEEENIREDLCNGISLRLNDNEWPVYFNSFTRWICIGDPSLYEKELIEFSKGCIASLKKDELRGIWLNPKFV